jgi:phosphatidylglycerophosphate synthase
MHKRSYYIINGITLYRLIVAPFLLVLLFTRQYDLFKWLLALSFFTDAIDGFLARRYKVVSAFGSRLDSIGDDLTTVVAVIGIIVMKPEFIKQELIWLIIIFILFLVQISLAFSRYKKLTSFHTYGAKIATILQGIFLILFFFLPDPVYWLFYLAITLTGLELIEEIIIIFVLPKWETDVKGLYWVLGKKRRQKS